MNRITGVWIGRYGYRWGVVAKINADNTSGVAIVLACETDFVAKNESYKVLASEFADVALNYSDKEAFLAADFGAGTVAEKLTEQTGVIGEKFPTQQIKGSIPDLVDKLREKQNKFIWFKAATAIMTTDTRPKLA